MKNIPWEPRPVDCEDVVWRYSKNPIIHRNEIKRSNSIFNSAVVPFKDGYAGVFRCDDKRREMLLHAGFSVDGVKWNINPEPIEFQSEVEDSEPFEYGYDPRVCFIEDRYYVTWCNGYHGPTIGIAYTFDFETFHQMENIFLPYNRNGVLFPRKINGKYAILSRPSDTGHTAFGDIFYSESPDLIHWGRHRHVMAPRGWWQSTKIGAGPVPIETKEGWLLFYHGVLTSCNGYVYSFGAAMLDLNEPWKVKYRTEPYLLSPQTLYECVGDVPNVVFPCAALHEEESGRIAIYYGCADTVTGVCFTMRDELIDFMKKNSKL
ncbi:glycoside hydrolase family 130 protein [Lachnoclostridium phytofermentans]|uniref:Glycosidase PH1107-related n=1 Tax=Lachnoclostridium phytofermentans (strain ATCC 700394 / DSM 18823 / ISDg) TaxID=357809 RepID=A9KS58_LACP7|nr:glycoside hydrolase family 130 protein [Lachnoclostridium phytofermentans]ABX42090.1 glycosidase PH1107-related [Lachnoclostridium phytofermentans ISDg]